MRLRTRARRRGQRRWRPQPRRPRQRQTAARPPQQRPSPAKWRAAMLLLLLSRLLLPQKHSQHHSRCASTALLLLLQLPHKHSQHHCRCASRPGIRLNAWIVFAGGLAGANGAQACSGTPAAARGQGQVQELLLLRLKRALPRQQAARSLTAATCKPLQLRLGSMGLTNDGIVVISAFCVWPPRVIGQFVPCLMSMQFESSAVCLGVVQLGGTCWRGGCSCTAPAMCPPLPQLGRRAHLQLQSAHIEHPDQRACGQRRRCRCSLQLACMLLNTCSACPTQYMFPFESRCTSVNSVKRGLCNFSTRH